MSAVKGRRQRAHGIGPHLVQILARVSPEARNHAHTTADTLGISFAAYLDEVLKRDSQQMDEHGKPLWWTDPVPADQEELPLKSA